MDDIFDPGLLRENPRQMSAATLAFLGDAVYELLARQKLAVTTIPAGKLHRMAIGMVCAGAQSQAYEVLEPLLTEEELAVLKRGRNTHPSHTAKNAKVADYRRATGVEALFGYLWLCGRTARLRARRHGRPAACSSYAVLQHGATHAPSTSSAQRRASRKHMKRPLRLKEPLYTVKRRSAEFIGRRRP